MPSRSIALTAVALVGVVAVCGGLWMRFSNQFPIPHDSGTIKAADLSKWESVLCVRFPNSIELLAGHWESALDSYARLRLRIPRLDVPAFIASSPFANEAPRAECPNQLRSETPDDPAWREIANAKNFRAWEARPRPGEVLLCQIVEDDAAFAIIYIVWFDT